MKIKRSTIVARPPLSVARALRFDFLEERRLFAGLEGGTLKVLVFEDPLSTRVATSQSTPAAERVVYIDLNRDGLFQSREPWAVTGADGVAEFKGLAAGNYSVQLVGNQRVMLETTSQEPEATGSWALQLGVRQALDWESDTIGWFASSHALQKWDTSSGKLIQEIDLDASISTMKVLDASRVVGLVQGANGLRAVAVDRANGTVGQLATNVDGLRSMTIVGNQILLLGNGQRGASIYQVSVSSVVGKPNSGLKAEWILDGFSSDTSIEAIGPRDFVAVEQFEASSRFSSYRYESGAWQLNAERSMEKGARFSSPLGDASRFAVETSQGIGVMSNASGMPMLQLLGQAVGPTIYDASRGILIAHSSRRDGSVLGFSSLDWGIRFASPITSPVAGQSGSPKPLTMGYLNDSMVALVDGHVYRHSLAAPSGVSVALADAIVQQVAIGVRARGINRAPSLGPLAGLTTDEDVLVSISQDRITSAGSDPDGDTLYYLVRTPGLKGKLEWSSTAFGVFIPNANANGADTWTIQAFDGRNWSEPRTLGIDIRPVNDLPTGFAVSGDYRVPELAPGASIGRLGVADVDPDAVYRYVVSDGRFVVADGSLKLASGVALDYEAGSSVVVTVTAIEANTRDSISQRITIQVDDRNDPPEGIILTGNGSVPEKKAPYVVGNIGVIDQDRSEVYDITVSDPRFEVVGSTVRVKSGSGIVYQDPGWIELTFVAVSRTSGDTLRRTERLRVIKDETPYHNDSNPMDVDGDGQVTPLDPLIIINHINQHGTGPVDGGEGEAGGDMDVDGDGRVSPMDILIIINKLNSQRLQGGSNSSNNPPGGEGEGAGQMVLAPSFWDGENSDPVWRRNRRGRR